MIHSQSQTHPDSRRKLQPRDPEHQQQQHLTMSTEEHIAQLTAQITALQAQLARRSWSPPPAPAQPSAPPPPPPNPPKVSPPSPSPAPHAHLHPSNPQSPP